MPPTLGRTSIPLTGGGETGNDRSCEEYVPVANRPCDGHLDELRKEGLIK